MLENLLREYAGKTVVIFGYSAIGQAVYKEIKDINEQIVCCFCDNDPKKQSSHLCGGAVYPVSYCAENYRDGLYFLTGLYRSQEMRLQLISLGIDEKNIYKYIPASFFLQQTREISSQFHRLRDLVCSPRYMEAMHRRKIKKCTLCGRESSLFLPGGIDSPIFHKFNIIGGGLREDCTCPYCYAGDRERWVYYVLQHFTDLFRKMCTVLHIAPEKGLAAKISQNRQCVYLSGDVVAHRAQYTVDVTQMKFENEKFDFIIMNHVLEHILEENKALNELKRCLKQDGKLILTFPICLDRPTYENKNAVTPQQRIECYGQEDHVRLYGIDARARLESFNFHVKEYIAKEIVSKEEIETYGFIAEDRVFVCMKS